jgi:hypothetical protein
MKIRVLAYAIAYLLAPGRLVASDSDPWADLDGLYATPPPQQVLVRLEHIDTGASGLGLIVAQVSTSDGHYKVFAGPVQIGGLRIPYTVVSPAYDPYGLLLDPSSLSNDSGSSPLLDHSQVCYIILVYLEAGLPFSCGDRPSTLTRLR